MLSFLLKMLLEATIVVKPISGQNLPNTLPFLFQMINKLLHLKCGRKRLCWWLVTISLNGLRVTQYQTRRPSLLLRNYSEPVYSQLSPGRTPLGPALSVRLREMSVL